MAVLVEAPYSLIQGTLITVQTQAQNLKGWSTLSTVNTEGAVVETEPVAPGAVARAATTDDTTVDVEWTALTTDAERGGPSTTVSSYNLQWAAGETGALAWTDLLGISPLSTATTFSATASNTESGTLPPGQLYSFRLRAKNVYGWGAFGPTTAIYAAAVPEAPAAPTSAQQGTSMRISWLAPDNNGLPVVAYEIRLQSKSSGWLTTTSCDGADSGDPSNPNPIVSNTFCDIAMTELRSTTYALVLNDQVLAEVKAYNQIGWGAYSQPTTTGGTITTEPSAPPTMVTAVAGTDDTQLVVTW